LKKLSALIIVLAVLFAINSESFAQPRLVITLKGGYSLPLGALGGDAADLFTQTPNTSTTRDHKLYVKTGFNFGADFKYAFDKKGTMRGVLGLGYAMFKNSYDIPTTTIGFGSGHTFKPEFNYFGASLGFEYAIQPKKKIVPFIGAGFAGYFYSGKPWVIDPVASDWPAEIKFKSGSRFGIYANLGSDFKVAKDIAINVGAKFNYINLIGKKEFDSTEYVTGLAANEIEMYDKEYTYGGVTYSAANLMSFDLSAGISFFLMQPKAKIKK
jgi:outer membrane protein W